MVTAVDVIGNESPFSAEVAVQPLTDSTPPAITSVSVNEGATVGGPSVYLYVSGTDNSPQGITLRKYEYSADQGASWALIGSSTGAVYWDTSGLTSGDISDPGGWKVTLSWTSGNESDLAGFRLYRSTVSGERGQLIRETTGTGYVDEPLTPGQAYYYTVEALDIYRNASYSSQAAASPSNEDPFAPVAAAGDDQVATVGMEVGFDGTLSSDNDSIASYLWDFGDGGTAFIAQPAHAFTAAGDYTVSLTVYDPAGNSSTDSLLVKVVPPQQVGTLEVRVIDDVSGAVLSGASVVVQFPDGTSQKSTTNGQGLANVVAGPGDYKIYAYKTDFKPAAVDATLVLNQKTTATVRLQRGQLVVGELTVLM